jgi:hypothetical protein
VTPSGIKPSTNCATACPTSTSIDVIINKKHCTEPAAVVEPGLADYQTQMLPVLSKNHGSVNRRVLKRHLGENNVREFKYLLNKEKVFTETEVNAKFKVFFNEISLSVSLLHLSLFSSDIERNHQGMDALHKVRGVFFFNLRWAIKKRQIDIT